MMQVTRVRMRARGFGGGGGEVVRAVNVAR